MNQVASPLENPNRSTGELHLAGSIYKELSAFVQNSMGYSFAQTSNAVRLIPSTRYCTCFVSPVHQPFRSIAGQMVNSYCLPKPSQHEATLNNLGKPYKPSPVRRRWREKPKVFRMPAVGWLCPEMRSNPNLAQHGKPQVFPMRNLFRYMLIEDSLCLILQSFFPPAVKMLLFCTILL